jgi:hypothetical protein
MPPTRHSRSNPAQPPAQPTTTTTSSRKPTTKKTTSKEPAIKAPAERVQRPERSTRWKWLPKSYVEHLEDRHILLDAVLVEQPYRMTHGGKTAAWLKVEEQFSSYLAAVHDFRAPPAHKCLHAEMNRLIAKFKV